jgi:hypothetical protein
MTHQLQLNPNSNFNPMKGKPWTPEETAELAALVDTIIRESGGNQISAEVKTLVDFANKCNRTSTAVSHKTRMLALAAGKIKTRRQMREEAQELMDSSAWHAEEAEPDPAPPTNPMTAQVVSIPLKQLYGKIDFETFMSLING